MKAQLCKRQPSLFESSGEEKTDFLTESTERQMTEEKKDSTIGKAYNTFKLKKNKKSLTSNEKTKPANETQAGLGLQMAHKRSSTWN